MRILKIPLIILMLIFSINQTQATIPERSGWWKFDNPSNLTIAEAGFGVALTLTGSQSAAAGPVEGNGGVLIGTGSYYKMNHLIAPNGGGSKVNEYTLQYDFKIPENGVWHCFFQTTLNNSNDGDFFINPSGNIGVADVGYSSNAINSNEWYRLLISVKNGSHFTCYLDGKLFLAGNIQDIDARFSLNNLLLVFADDDGEDANIYCSELAIWAQALTADQATELGGYTHIHIPFTMTRIPYLQGAGPNTMNVCWHDTATAGTKVNYGIDTTLSMVMQGNSEMVSDPYRWHTVKLTGLLPNTRYFYKVESGNGVSGMYSFRTLPDSTYSGKVRFVILGDTHASDTTMAGKVLRATRAKITELYGPDIENHVNGIFHTGDIVVSGSIPEHYTTQYFQPLSTLSANLPTMVVAGNHEGESPYFYRYLKLDDQSAFPQLPALNEKIWQEKVGNSLFIGLNTNIIDQYGVVEANWLDSRLDAAEADPGIDFVFLFFHHPPFSELWSYVNTFDGGANYVKNVLLPIIKKYTKVQELHYGHTHGFERGTIHSEKAGGDFRIICGGGGGGPLDPWAEGENHDYNDIHVCISNYFFQILEIDIANHAFQNSMYSLGTLNDPKNSERLDSWYKKKNQEGPLTPVAENAEILEESIQFNSSSFLGTDSIMSVQLQVMESADSTYIAIDTLLNWENIYGVDLNHKPIDLNRGINLYRTKLNLSLFSDEMEYLFRVRYRDHNLKWSNWSEPTRFNTVGINDDPSLRSGYLLNQNYPNPFRNETTFSYYIPEKCEVVFRIYDSSQRLISEINEGMKLKGTYNIFYNSEKMNSNVYIYKMKTKKFSFSKKMTCIK